MYEYVKIINGLMLNKKARVLKLVPLTFEKKKVERSCFKHAHGTKEPGEYQKQTTV